MKNLLLIVSLAFFLPISVHAESDLDKAGKELQMCYWRAFNDAQIGAEVLRNCMYEGVNYCQVSGFSEQGCMDHITAIYTSSYQAFQQEFYAFNSAINMGAPYTPTFFDMRKIAKGR